MTSRREQALGYAILGVFSLIALFPIAGILLTALQEPGRRRDVRRLRRPALRNFTTAWSDGQLRRST